MEQQLKHKTPGNFLESQWLALDAIEKHNSKQCAIQSAPTQFAPTQSVPTPSVRLATPLAPMRAVPTPSVRLPTPPVRLPTPPAPTVSVPTPYRWQPPAQPEAEAGPSTRRPLDHMDVNSKKGERSVQKSMKHRRGGEGHKDDKPVKAKRLRVPIVGTGKYHSPACLWCVKGKAQCERQLKPVWACVRCGTMKAACKRGQSTSKQCNWAPSPAPAPSPSPSPSPPPTKRRRHTAYTTSDDGSQQDQIKDLAPIRRLATIHRPALTSSSSSSELIRKPALAPTKSSTLKKATAGKTRLTSALKVATGGKGKKKGKSKSFMYIFPKIHCLV